jgi:hypothetical protein
MNICNETMRQVASRKATGAAAARRPHAIVVHVANSVLSSGHSPPPIKRFDRFFDFAPGASTASVLTFQP